MSQLDDKSDENLEWTDVFLGTSCLGDLIIHPFSPDEIYDLSS